jgi:hypothetical protein
VAVRDPRTLKRLNPEAGDHDVPDDPRELEAAIRAGVISLERCPYYGLRYGERGAAWTRSDSAWLVTLARSPRERANVQVGWLGTLLSARGMPQWLLEQHLLVLADELTAAVPDNAAQYEGLRATARELARQRRRHLSDGDLEACAALFEAEVGPEQAGLVPGLGILLAAAVADEACGIERAVSSMLEWLVAGDRFSVAYRTAVSATLEHARRLAGGHASGGRT